MKTKIYYFSGTGNSLCAAESIAGMIGGAELISVRCIAEDNPADDAEVIGFVCPVYEWDIPGAKKDFVSRLRINPNAYIFMVATYIAIHGRCFETIEQLLHEKGAHLSYSKAIRCVASQCIDYPPFPPEKLMLPYMERQIKKAGRGILQRKTADYPRMSALTRRLYPRVMGPYMAVEKEYDRGFFTDERCTGCGICSRVCPTGNITLEDGHPVWNHRCHGCNACVAYCPAKAVQFRTPSAYRELGTFISKRLRLPEKRKRYHHPSVKASDLMSDRKTVSPEHDHH